jgi:hypothetical protein
MVFSVLKLNPLENLIRSALAYMAAKAKHRDESSLVAPNVVFLELDLEKQS